MISTNQILLLWTLTDAFYCFGFQWFQQIDQKVFGTNSIWPPCPWYPFYHIRWTEWLYTFDSNDRSTPTHYFTNWSCCCFEDWSQNELNATHTGLLSDWVLSWGSHRARCSPVCSWLLFVFSSGLAGQPAPPWLGHDLITQNRRPLGLQDPFFHFETIVFLPHIHIH